MRRARPYPCSGPNASSALRTMRSSVPWRTSDLGGVIQSLIVLQQIHSGVEAGDLVAVSVEHQRISRIAEEVFTQAQFTPLAMARTFSTRIHIGVKAVLRGPI